MSSFSDYYEKRLYPLQDGVLKCVAGCGTEFFLTGGTALNRGFHKKKNFYQFDGLYLPHGTLSSKT
jgi:hypothetical protein